MQKTKFDKPWHNRDLRRLTAQDIDKSVGIDTYTEGFVSKTANSGYKGVFTMKDGKFEIRVEKGLYQNDNRGAKTYCRGKRHFLRFADAQVARYVLTMLSQWNDGVSEEDGHTNVCNFCYNGGELLLCSGCPRTYHSYCSATWPIPLSNYYCHHCLRASSLHIMERTPNPWARIHSAIADTAQTCAICEDESTGDRTVDNHLEIEDEHSRHPAPQQCHQLEDTEDDEDDEEEEDDEDDVEDGEEGDEQDHDVDEGFNIEGAEDVDDEESNIDYDKQIEGRVPQPQNALAIKLRDSDEDTDPNFNEDDDKHIVTTLSTNLYNEDDKKHIVTTPSTGSSTNEYSMSAHKNAIRFHVTSRILDTVNKRGMAHVAIIDVPNGILSEIKDYPQFESCKFWVFNMNPELADAMRSDYDGFENVHVVCGNVIDLCPRYKMDTIWIDGMTDFYNDDIMEHFRSWANPKAFFACTYTCRSKSRGGFERRQKMIEAQNKRLTLLQDLLVRRYTGKNSSAMIDVSGTFVSKPAKLSGNEKRALALCLSEEWDQLQPHTMKKLCQRMTQNITACHYFNWAAQGNAMFF